MKKAPRGCLSRLKNGWPSRTILFTRVLVIRCLSPTCLCVLSHARRQVVTCRFPLQCLLYLAKKWKSLCTCLPLAQAGRGPKWKYPRIEPDENVIFIRAIKQRNQTGRLLGILEEVTWGEEKAVWQRIDKDGEGWHISTFCVERDNLTSRLHNSRLPAPSSARQAGLVRKTLRFSKQREMLEAAVGLEDAYFNFCLPHDALKRPLAVPVPTCLRAVPARHRQAKGNGSPKKWSPHTPMIAEGLTHHACLCACLPRPTRRRQVARRQVWTLEELLPACVRACDSTRRQVVSGAAQTPLDGSLKHMSCRDTTQLYQVTGFYITSNMA